MEWIIKILKILPYIVVLLGIWSVVKKIRSGKSITWRKCILVVSLMRMNNCIGQGRKRNQTLLVVEGNHEKNKLFWLILQSRFGYIDR